MPQKQKKKGLKKKLTETQGKILELKTGNQVSYILLPKNFFWNVDMFYKVLLRKYLNWKLNNDFIQLRKSNLY